MMLEPMKIFLTFYFSLIIIASVGCVGHSPREKFLSAQGESRSNFAELYPVSIESLKQNEHDLLRRTSNISNSFRQLSHECPKITETADRIDRVAKEIFEEKMSRIEELEKLFVPHTDSLFFFDYADDQVTEVGWLVVTNNKIKAKVLLGGGTIKNR